MSVEGFPRHMHTCTPFSRRGGLGRAASFDRFDRHPDVFRSRTRGRAVPARVPLTSAGDGPA